MMRQVALGVLLAVLAAPVWSSDLAAALSPDRPQDRAILAYLELAEAEKATASDLTELGVLLTEKGLLADAEHWLREAVKADKHLFAARYRLGLVQQRQGKCDDAAKTFARALDEQPDDPYATFMLALTKERCGQASAAISDFARAYRLLPELASPEKNPLVLDSKVQLEANLQYYRETVTARTMPVTALDPAAVKAMMSARPAPPVATPPADPTVPPAETIPAPAPAAAVVPPAATPGPTPRPGAPGAPAPSGMPGAKPPGGA
jgi:tetratricopeptide (TPR) repeat protein